MLNFNKMLNTLRPQPVVREAALHSEMEEIYVSLDKIRQSHALIYVALGSNSSRAYQSIILAVDRDSGSIEIDELFPAGLLLDEGDRVSVTIRQSRQQSLTFHTRVNQRRAEGPSTSYVLSLPNHLDGHQRRNAFRLSTHGRAQWCDQEQDFDHAQITNISISGVQLEIPRELDDAVCVGENIENCQLQLASLNVTCGLRVTRKSPADENADITTIGAKLVTLDPLARRKLEQFIMREQRHQRVRSN